MRTLLACFLLLSGARVLPAAKNLEIYSIDVEGGQATLFVSPAGESLLVDTGWAGNNHRDAERIAAAATAAGVKKIDYLVITHFHADHVGGVPQLSEKLPIRNFVDHGASVESGKNAEVLFNAYKAFRQKGNHIQAKPGETIPMKGLDVKVVSSDGNVLGAALPDAGQANASCASYKEHAPDATENARSVGTLITFAGVRILDLGDLTWNKEHDLVCPVNKIGPVDILIVSHHGADSSNSPQLLHAIQPRVAIMPNGAKKGGVPAAWEIVHGAPRLEDLWQLHFAIAGGKEHNSPDTVIANVDEICEGKGLKVEVRPDGSFTVANSRNKFEKTYAKK